MYDSISLQRARSNRSSSVITFAGPPTCFSSNITDRWFLYIRLPLESASWFISPFIVFYTVFGNLAQYYCSSVLLLQSLFEPNKFLLLLVAVLPRLSFPLLSTSINPLVLNSRLTTFLFTYLHRRTYSYSYSYSFNKHVERTQHITSLRKS